MDSKKPWQSKTIWMSVIVGAAAFFPGVQHWITANPEMFATGLSGLFLLLRVVTNGKITIVDDTAPAAIAAPAKT